MLEQAGVDVLPRRRPERFPIALVERRDGAAGVAVVPGQRGRVVGPFVVVRDEPGVVELVDGVGAGEVLLAQVRGAVGPVLVVRQRVQRPVRGVAWISLAEGARAARAGGCAGGSAAVFGAASRGSVVGIGGEAASTAVAGMPAMCCRAGRFFVFAGGSGRRPWAGASKWVC